MGAVSDVVASAESGLERRDSTRDHGV